MAAILEAAVNVSSAGIAVHPHIMVPLVGILEELECQVDAIKKTAQRVFQAKGREVQYSYGTMIEVPRGALQVRRVPARVCRVIVCSTLGSRVSSGMD